MSDERKFIRVETFDMKENGTIGGYMCALNMLLCILTGTKPTEDEVALQKSIDQSDNPLVEELLTASAYLADIPQPVVYVEDKKNHVCLYTIDEYEDAAETLMRVSDILEDMSDRFILGYQEFYLDDDEIIYEDDCQIVITKEVYEKHKIETDIVLYF